MSPLSEMSLLIILWSIAGLVLCFTCLPSLLGLLGFTRFWTEFEENPARLEPGGADESYADAHRQLIELGFVPLGVYWEHARFLAHHWFKSFELKSFASKTHGCFGQIYRLFPGDSVRVYFATCFEDGTYVCTANHMEEFIISQPGYYRWGVETTDLAAVLEQHQQMAARVGGERPIAAAQTLEVLTATMTPPVNRYFQSNRSDAQCSLMTGLTEPGITTALAVSLFGIGHWLVPVAVVVGCIRKAVLQTCMLSQIARDRNERIAREKQSVASPSE